MTWHLIVDAEGRPGAENMALDQALLEGADRDGRAVLRLYRWDPPCLSLGRHESAAARYDRGVIERRGISVVRRPTGGRAVWHEHEVTYAVAAPIATFGSLRDSYRAIHGRLAGALQALGIEATLAPDRLPRPLGTARPPDRLGSCFSAPVGGEILAHGRKLVGSAQVRRGTAFLQHGSILLDGSQEIARAVSREQGARSGETTLRQALGRPVGFGEVVDAIVAAWGAPLQPAARPPDRLTATFLDPAWTWRR